MNLIKEYLLTALVFISVVSVAFADAPRPNIIVILCDDLGYADVGFNGAKDIKTAELDRLAASGTIFSSAYVAHPFCGPSRMGLMAGRYPHEFGAPFNLPNSGLGIESYNQEGIDVNEVLISTVLQDAGYFTGAIGKWHMGWEPQFHPNNRGFDDYYGFLGGGHQYFPEKFKPAYERQKKRGVKWINDYLLPLEHNGVEVDEKEYITDALSREAVRFVTQAAEKEEPFFLYLAYNAPHSPLEATEEDLKLYSHIDDKKRRTYAAMVHAVDRGVGELVASLKETGEYEDTLIVFFSDNGGKESLGADNGPLRNGKGSVAEGGFRVPMFFHWPEKVPEVVYPHPVSALDFYPTFASLAGASIPEGKKLDGKNIWEDLLAGRNPRADEMIMAVRHRLGYSDVGARQDQWKLRREGTGPWQFFNVEDDIGENKDLSSDHPHLMRSMISEVEAWSKSHTDPRFFYTEEEGEQWEAKSMPRYDETFALEGMESKR